MCIIRSAITSVGFKDLVTAFRFITFFMSTFLASFLRMPIMMIVFLFMSMFTMISFVIIIVRTFLVMSFFAYKMDENKSIFRFLYVFVFHFDVQFKCYYLCDLHQIQIRVCHLFHVHLFSNHGIHVRCHTSCDHLFSLRYRRTYDLYNSHLYFLCYGIQKICAPSYDISYVLSFHLN